MMKFIALVVLLGCFSASSITAMADARGKPAAGQVDSFVIGERFQIESKVLKETRTYIIHTPPTYQSGNDAYPVLVLQDAEPNFAMTTAVLICYRRVGAYRR